MKKTEAGISYFVLVTLIVSIIIVVAVAVSEGTQTPEEHFSRGMTALKEKNYQVAEKAFVRVANTERSSVATQASWQLGNLYRVGETGVAMNGVKAELFLTKAAAAGFAPAQYELALMYDVGDKIPENRAKAKQWMNLAAQSGLVDAVYGLGVWIERGYFGEPDMEKVVTLYEQAAEQGHPNAMRSLVVLYGEGFGGFPRQLERAAYWLDQIKKQAEKE